MHGEDGKSGSSIGANARVSNYATCSDDRRRNQSPSLRVTWQNISTSQFRLSNSSSSTAEWLPHLLTALQYHDPKRIPVPLTHLHQNILVLQRLLPLRAQPFCYFLRFSHPPPLFRQDFIQFLPQDTGQKASLGVTVEERYNAHALFRCSKCFVVRELAGEKEIGGDIVEDGTTAAGAYRDGADFDIFDLSHLGDSNREAFGVADTASYALDQVGEGLGCGEGHEATHTGGFEAL